MMQQFFRRFSVMDRYLILELTSPFLLGVGLFSSLGIAIGVLFDLIRQVSEIGMPIAVALKILCLKSPEYIAYALPISLLLATLMAYSRLSSDSELIALRSCGISLYRLLTPVLVFSLIMTGITFLFNEMVVPEANYEARMTLQPFLEETTPATDKNHLYYPEYIQIPQGEGEPQRQLQELFYADRFDGEQMQNLTFLRWSGDKLTQIILCDGASWNSGEQAWDLSHGATYRLTSGGNFQKITPFETRQLAFSRAPLDLATKGRDPFDMNINQTLERIELLKSAGDQRQVRMLKVRVQQRLAFPFVCLIFGLLGAALGSRPQQNSRALCFGISIAVVFGYYLSSFLLGGFGFVGLIPALVAGWLPNVLGLGISGWLLIRQSYV